MNEQVVAPSESLWRELVSNQRQYLISYTKFMSEAAERVQCLRQGLRSGGVDRSTALQIIPYLDLTERMRLYGDLVFLASSAHGAIGAVRHLLLSLPRDFLLGSIELEAEPYLQNGTYDEYRRFLELYELLDRDLTLKLAHRAAVHPDPDIREAGEDYLERLVEHQVHAQSN